MLIKGLKKKMMLELRLAEVMEEAIPYPGGKAYWVDGTASTEAPSLVSLRKI